MKITTTTRSIRALELLDLARRARLHSLAYVPAEQRARISRDAALEQMRANPQDLSAIRAFDLAQSWHTGAAESLAAILLNAEKMEALADLA